MVCDDVDCPFWVGFKEAEGGGQADDAGAED